ncbi:hypothetical protein Tco_0829088 [Tanacetum coccineum]
MYVSMYRFTLDVKEAACCTDEVLKGTAQEYESTAGANLSTAEVYESTAHDHIQGLLPISKSARCDQLTAEQDQTPMIGSLITPFIKTHNKADQVRVYKDTHDDLRRRFEITETTAEVQA